MSVSVTADIQDQPNPWDGSVGLIFLGFEIRWMPKVSDYRYNLRFAEMWEESFETWIGSGRRLELVDEDGRYFVTLDDGSAHFRCESSDAYWKAIEHVTELLRSLTDRTNEPAHSTFDAQFLLPTNETFKKHQDFLRSKLLQDAFHTAIGVRVTDFAYLTDCVINSQWYQINIGPVRAREISDRVAARTLRERPAVSTFLSVISRSILEAEARDLSRFALETVRVGNTIASELTQ